MSQVLTIGKIVNTHGLKGDVKVYPYTSDNSRFEDIGHVFLDQGFTKKLTIASVRYQKQMVILKFEGYNHINDVEVLLNKDLYIDRESQGQDLDEDEYYNADLIGLRVCDESGQDLGQVKDVIQNAYQDTLEITSKTGVWYLPFVEAFVLNIDLDKGQVTVRLIEGLRDEN